MTCVVGANEAAIATSGPRPTPPAVPSRELANKMSVMDHKVRAPAMGRVDLADFQNDVEPRVEVELVATEAERDQDSRHRFRITF